MVARVFVLSPMHPDKHFSCILSIWLGKFFQVQALFVLVRNKSNKIQVFCDETESEKNRKND